MNLKDTNPKDAVGIRKVSMSVVPANVVCEIALGMMDGATKYGRHNYRVSGIRASVYYDAAMRHLMAWWEGEDLDTDSGMHHVTKALSTLTVLRDAMHNGRCDDDRPPRTEPFMHQLNVIAAALVSSRAGNNVTHYTQAGLDHAPPGLPE